LNSNKRERDEEKKTRIGKDIGYTKNGRVKGGKIIKYNKSKKKITEILSVSILDIKKD